MGKHRLIGLLMICSIVILFTMPSFSQQNPISSGSQNSNPASGSTNERVAPVKAEAPQPEEMSIYGEVQSVDASTNSLKVQYYDYDSDQEKSIEITANKDTKLEKALSLNDIKKGDWADITYTVSDAKNMAASISIEKDEESAETSADTSTKEER